MIGFLPLLVSVRESEGTFVIKLMADGISDFNYNVTIDIINNATGM